ncbi:MAG TPA: pyruvoyl-dependent arginine decarboxylase [Candidatus Saccharimonadia bacterium]
MNIYVTAGAGSASTSLGAFDQALLAAGIANYNLIYLSSIVPHGSTIVTGERPQLSGEWGDRLYVVIAQARTSIPNVEAWAGLGWAQHEETGKGLFVEHHGASKSTVEREIEQSLETLMQGRPNEKFGPIQMQVEGLRCETAPVCVLVAATFITENW